MANSVENRVVSLKFDNAAFAQKISGTISALDKLNGSISKAGDNGGLTELSKAASNFKMEGVSSAVEGVSKKFLLLSTVAVTALATITKKAIDTGANIVKAFTIDPINDGFKEYETNMNSIQTILANTSSKGSTLDDVSDALDLLNTYADQTIYNFSEMTRNIGTFTAAGVDLETSTNAIKGIANLAAISGSNSNQASTAMYQLSQALAAGSLKLQDWNSVVNAGLGGEVFQKALFESGKALGTIADTPITQTFEEWKEAGNTFRGSLEEGWITGEVLTNTLQGFTGDLTKAQILALGYTEEQVAEIERMGAVGKAAATEVKTFTQLIDTVKEAVGSGWSQSFKLIIGDFNEAKALFTSISDFLGQMIGDSADARNELLSDFKRLGGRQVVIRSIQRAIEALGKILHPIRQAFRDVFPKTTVSTLIKGALAFSRLTSKMVPGYKTVRSLRTAFKGFFDGVKIGIEIIKGAFGVITNLFRAFAPSGDGILKTGESFGLMVTKLRELLVEGGGISDFFDKFKPGEKTIANVKTLFQGLADAFSVGIEIFKGVVSVVVEMWKAINPSTDGASSAAESIGEFLTRMKEVLVTGGAISSFFETLREKIRNLRTTFLEVKETLKGIFGNDTESEGDATASVFDRVKQRLSQLKEVVTTVVGAFSDLIESFTGFEGPDISKYIEGMKEELSKFWDAVKETFSGDEDESSSVIDAVNAGLFAGILGAVALFIKNVGDVFDGAGDILDGVADSFDELGDVLGALETSIKADALMKIATAMAVLTASLVVLSLIDADALTKALAATAAGFAQLATTMALLSRITTTVGAAKIVAAGLAMVFLGGAILILAAAMKIMATMSWEEIGKGLATTTALLIALVLATNSMSGMFRGMVKAGIGIGLIAVSMVVLAGAMKIMATMEWEEIGKGLAGIAGGLAAIVAAMNLLPKGMVKKAAGILLVGVALNLIAYAMKQFSGFSWEEIGKGLAGVAGSLVAIGLAMRLMPAGPAMVAQSAGLLLVGVALNLIAQAMKGFASMDWDEIGRGLAAMAGALAVLAIAAYAMSGTLLGAAAIALMAVSLGSLIPVLQAAANLSFGDLAKGLAVIAIALTVLGAAAYALLATGATVAILALAGTMLVLAAAMALFGVGAILIAKAFEILAKSGKAGVELLLTYLDLLIDKLPEILKALSEAVIGMVMVWLEAVPELLVILGDIIESLLDVVIQQIPKIVETGKVLALELLAGIKEVFPEIVDTGLAMLLALLNGISENIEEIATLALDILKKFTDVLTEKTPDLVDSGVALLVALIEGIEDNVETLVTAAKDLVTAFLKELGGYAVEVIAAGAELIAKIIEGFGSAAEDLVTAGADAIISFLEGVASNVVKVIDAGFQIVVDMLNGIADSIRENRSELVDAGINILSAVFEGVTDRFEDVGKWFSDLPGTIVEKIGSTFETLKTTGVNLMKGFYNGVISFVNETLSSWFGDLPDKIVGWIGSTFTKLNATGANLVIGLWNGIAGKIQWIKDKISGMIGSIVSSFDNALDINSPSKVFIERGKYIGEGLGIGIESMEDSVGTMAKGLASSVVDGFESQDLTEALRKTVAGLPEAFSDLNDLNPTITPVLDLTALQKDAKAIDGLIPSGSLASVSYTKALGVASATQPADEPVDDDIAGISEVTFNQTINAPTALSTADIYRGTKSQIAIAKEELSIR